MHVYPSNKRPSSLLMASSNLAPAVDAHNSLYSAAIPVSGLMAVLLLPVCRRALRRLSSVGTPRAGAWGAAWSVMGAFFVLTGMCCSIVSKNRRRRCLCVSSMVLANVSVGGFFRRTTASSMVAQSKSMLLRHGKGCLGNHMSWFTILVCLVFIVHTVKHR